MKARLRPRLRIADRPLVAVDFDGVLHRNVRPFERATIVQDLPVPGAIDWLVAAQKTVKIAIYSCRSNDLGGIEAMSDWLLGHLTAHLGTFEAAYAVLADIEWPHGKPHAAVYLDDRAWRFTGEFPSAADLVRFTPWLLKP